jgi:hypothetical protein
MHSLARRVAAVIGSSLLVVSAVGCAGDEPDATPTSVAGPGATEPGEPEPGEPEPGAPDTSGSRPSRPSGGFGTSRLTFFGECDDLLAYLQAETLDRVTAWGLGYGGYYPMAVRGDMTASTEAPAAMDESAGAPLDDGPAYSTTNTQEQGVDEGDIVETNGGYVFVASTDGVRIVDVERADVVERLDVPEGEHQLLLDDDRLLVATQLWANAEESVVSLYDVSDIDAPALVRRTHVEGRLVATRAVDGSARLVLSSSIAVRLPFVTPDRFGLDEERALAANREVIESSTIEDWMPRWFDETADGSFGPLGEALDCANVAAPRDFAGLGISWIATIDLDPDRGSDPTGPIGSAGVVSTGDTVYASTDHLYLATVPWDWSMGNRAVASEQPPTLIHQFALDDAGSASYRASGEVPGRLLNQFAMSEYDGLLRVATTLDQWNGTQPSESSVRVLRPDGDELVEIGSVSGLGVTEQIYAVRFIGPTAYVVTFRQTDPLYVIDLSDPTTPVVSGELKIPGYSAYLHPVGEGLLLGVGQDADEQGVTRGTKLSLFDVSDPAAPVEVSSLMIGGSSEAEWDHHAFLYWPADGTIVIPTSPMWGPCPAGARCLVDGIAGADGTAGTDGTNGADGDDRTGRSVGGAAVVQLVEGQLEPRGLIGSPSDVLGGCWNPMQRSLIIGSEIVTVGFGSMAFSDRESLELRDAATWGGPEQYGCGYWID